MTISSVGNSGNNEYKPQESSNSDQTSNQQYEYIWGTGKKTKNLNAEMNEIFGNNGIDSYEESVELAQYCLDLKLGYNSGNRDYKASDIKTIEEMVKKAHRDFPKPKSSHGI